MSGRVLLMLMLIIGAIFQSDGRRSDECYEDSYCEKSMGIKSKKCCSNHGAGSFMRSGTCNICYSNIGREYCFKELECKGYMGFRSTKCCSLHKAKSFVRADVQKVYGGTTAGKDALYSLFSPISCYKCPTD